MLKFKFKLVNIDDSDKLVVCLERKELSVSVINSVIANSTLDVSLIVSVNKRSIDPVRALCLSIEFSWKELFDLKIDKFFIQSVDYVLKIDQELAHSFYTYGFETNRDKESSIYYKFDRDRFLTWLKSTDMYKTLYDGELLQNQD